MNSEDGYQKFSVAMQQKFIENFNLILNFPYDQKEEVHLFNIWK